MTAVRHFLIRDEEGVWGIEHEGCPLIDDPMSDPEHPFLTYDCHEAWLQRNLGLTELLGDELDRLDPTTRHEVRAWASSRFVDNYHHYGWEGDEGLEVVAGSATPTTGWDGNATRR